MSLTTPQVNAILSHTIKTSFIEFCREQKIKISQENFDLLHDFRDRIILDLEAKSKEDAFAT